MFARFFRRKSSAAKHQPDATAPAFQKLELDLPEPLLSAPSTATQATAASSAWTEVDPATPPAVSSAAKLSTDSTANNASSLQIAASPAAIKERLKIRLDAAELLSLVQACSVQLKQRGT